MANNITNVWKLMGIDPTTGTGTYKNRMGLGNAITRDNGIPLDLSTLHATYNDAVVYAATSSIAYVDQPIAAEGVLYLITEESQGKVKISSYRDSITGKLVTGEEKEYDVYLKRVGIVPTGDDASIIVSGEGLIKLFAFDGAQAGAVPVKEDGKLVWKTLEEIGAGDGNDNTTYEITPLRKAKPGEGDTHEEGEIYGIIIEEFFNGVSVPGTEENPNPKIIEFNVYTKSETDKAIKVLADKIGIKADPEKEIEATGLYKQIADEITRATNAESALSDRIGVAKNGETAATGVYAYVDGVVNALVEGVDPDKIDSLNELIAWVEAHPDIVSGLDERLDAVEGILDGIGGEGEKATVKAYVDDAFTAHESAADSKYATKQEITDADYAVASEVEETYATKQELTDHNTAAEAKYATKDELKATDDVAKDAQNRVDIVEGKIDEITSVGGEPNVIEKIKVNGVTLEVEKDAEGKSTKTVSLSVPTSIVGMEGYSALDGRITTNANAIAALEGQLGTTNTNVSGLTTRLAALEAEVGEVAESRIDALEGVTAQHTTDIGANTTAITTLNTETIPALQQAIADGDKAINDKIGTVTEGKTVVDMINAVAGTIDFSPYAKTEDVAKTYATIAALEAEASRADTAEKQIAGDLAAEIARADAAEKANAAEIARVNAVLVAAIENEDDTALNSIKELAVWIEEHETEVLPVIEQQGKDIVAVGNRVTAVETAVSTTLPGAITQALTDAKAYTDEKMVKADGTSIVNNEGTFSIGAVSTDNLVQGKMTLVLNGGDAEVTA